MKKEGMRPARPGNFDATTELYEIGTFYRECSPVFRGPSRAAKGPSGKWIGTRRLLVSFVIAAALCLGFVHEAAALEDEAGFMEIEPVSFSFRQNGSQMNLTSSTARLWYVFQTADEDSSTRPLFVFFNGGPGCATSDALLSFNTSRMTMDSGLNGGKEIGANPVSWTRLGNLLYVDARETGFSYNLMPNPQSGKARHAQFDAQNFNPFLDGADFVRLILRFLSDHPTVQKNPVIIVGESYGGIRATVILHLLLNYGAYADGRQIYLDKSLMKEIQAHYNAVFPLYKDRIVPPAVIARQFGRQILIQPAVSPGYQTGITGQMFEEKGSIIYRVARETGQSYTPCSQQKGECDPYDNAMDFIDSTAKRDIYDYAKPRDWLEDHFAAAAQKLNFSANLSELIGTDVVAVAEMYAATRSNAYRVIETADTDGLSRESILGLGAQRDTRLPLVERLRGESVARSQAKIVASAGTGAGDLTEVFGVLKKWDRYLMDTNMDVNIAFYENRAIDKGFSMDPWDPLYGAMFLNNVVHVKTFITNAARDLVMYSAATPKALARYPYILSSVTHDTGAQTGVERPGRIILNYRPGALGHKPGLAKRIIRFPIYSVSCHSVPVTQPRELFSDVTAWLNEN